MIPKTTLRVLCLSLGLLFSCQANDGIDGANGKNSQTVISKEIAGPHCPYGGVKITAGVDQNIDNQLSEDEISDVKYVCDGIDDPISKTTRILIHNDNGGATGASSTTGNQYPAIVKFDKRNWSNLTSIKYSTNIRTEDASVEAITYLYAGYTWRKVPGSEIKTTSTTYKNLLSDELIDAFPNGEFMLGLGLKAASNSSKVVFLSKKTELILTQKKQVQRAH